MNKVFIILTVFFCAAAALANPGDRGLPETATEQVRNSTSQMVSQGFNAKEVIDMTREMLDHNFSQQQVMQAHAVLLDAQRQGLQTEPIMSKAREGMAKQVPAKAVVHAMEQVRSREAFATKQAMVITNDRARANQAPPRPSSSGPARRRPAPPGAALHWRPNNLAPGGIFQPPSSRSSRPTA